MHLCKSKLERKRVILRKCVTNLSLFKGITETRKCHLTDTSARLLNSRSWHAHGPGVVWLLTQINLWPVSITESTQQQPTSSKLQEIFLFFLWSDLTHHQSQYVLKSCVWSFVLYCFSHGCFLKLDFYELQIMFSTKLCFSVVHVNGFCSQSLSHYLSHTDL